MRIVGGEYRSRLIEMPKSPGIRPTQDKVRQAIFNMLGDISGKTVLDIFAGSGAFGIESISRGAGAATFVDNDPRCINAIKRNLHSLKIPDNMYTIIRANGLACMPGFEKDARRFDLVFMDPPYYKDMARKCLINLDSCDILSQFVTIVVEHHRKDELDLNLKRLVPDKERRYGDTLVTILKAK